MILKDRAGFLIDKSRDKRLRIIVPQGIKYRYGQYHVANMAQLDDENSIYRVMHIVCVSP